VKFWLFVFLFLCLSANAHPPSNKIQHSTANTAHYLGNEAVLIDGHSHKVLFDPFFHNGFGIYQKVPQTIRQAIFNGNVPYNNVDLIVISHAHEDHFSASDVVRYMQLHEKVQLIAPKQAVDKLTEITKSADVTDRVHSVHLAFNDAPWESIVSGIRVEAVRIPHAGWPGRADVENLVFRITVDNKANVIHMGDADPQIEHYQVYQSHWDKRTTQLGFPPYWFLDSAEGRYILDKTMKIEQAVGIHVPIKVPFKLEQSGRDYFSKPGEKRTF